MENNDKKKKIVINVVTVIVCVLLIVLGIFVYKKFTTVADELPVEEPISTEALFTVENYPKVDGSTATLPLAEAFE